ncbi:acyl-CoA dehydrogenase family protein [Streptomyces sp. NPDC127084]|uniref:acyl-CoA dehydrogenase family protein n=1 Tax=Streptomyces sp. NPDC127084 TaxID=3347133 RepID=UPI00364907F3
MRFQLTDDQRALRRGVRELLEARFDRDALRAAVDKAGGEAGGEPGDGPGPRLDRALWRVLGDAGFFALRLPEDAGGVGLGLPEAVLVFEEVGRVLLPGPLVATHLAAGVVPGAATGEAVVTMPDGALVAWLDEADAVLGDSGAVVGEADAGLGERGAVPGEGNAAGAVRLRSVDPLTPLHRLLCAAVGGVHDETQSDYVDYAALLTAAEQLGSALRTTELATRYAREREQFGRPIGSFQAVKHLCAQMFVRAELARAAVYAAAVTADPAEIAGAKLLADEAAVRGARDCLQVHGGMGFTWEADVHLHLKRAWVRARLWQTAERTEEVLASAL